MKLLPLKEICVFYAGTGFPIKNQGNKNEELPFYKVGDISRNVLLGYRTLEVCENYVSRNTAKLLHGTIIPKGAIVFAKIGEALKLNRRGITKQDCLVDNNAISLYPRIEIVELAYFYYLLCSIDMAKLSHSTAFPSIKKSTLENLKVKVYDLSQQKIITKELDYISAAISAKKTVLLELNALIKSRFIELFETIDLSEQSKDWKELGSITNIFTGTTPSTSDASNWNGNILWITPAEMTSDSYYIFDTERKITEKGRKSKGLQIMPVDTVLLSTRAPIGKTGIVGSPMACNQGFKNFKCNGQLNPIFLYTLLRNNTQYLNSLGSGSTFLEISKTVVSKVRIPVPPITLQNEFAEYVKLIDKSKFIVQQQIKDLQELLDKKMDEYFN